MESRAAPRAEVVCQQQFRKVAAPRAYSGGDTVCGTVMVTTEHCWLLSRDAGSDVGSSFNETRAAGPLPLEFDMEADDGCPA